MNPLNTIANIIFPVNCLACGKSGADFCLECLSQCSEAERESAEWLFPLYDYRQPNIKKAISLLKYKGKKRLAHIFANLLYGRILEELSELSQFENFREPILIPIPLSPKRLRERGFNQALLICQNLIKIDKNSTFGLEKDVLIKPKETPHQARIENRTERLKNIVGSFAVRNSIKIKGRNIILIDDVTTTGATLTEAKKVLKRAGAKKVIAFAVAH